MYDYWIKSVIKVDSSESVTIDIDLGFDTSVTKTLRLWGITSIFPVAGNEGKIDEAKKYITWWLARYHNSDLRVRTRLMDKKLSNHLVADIYYMSDGFEVRLSDVLVEKGLVEPIRKDNFYCSQAGEQI